MQHDEYLSAGITDYSWATTVQDCDSAWHARSRSVSLPTMGALPYAPST